MVGQLVRLKWRLLSNGLRADRQRRIGLPLLAALVAFGAVRVSTGLHGALTGLGDAAAVELSLWAALIAWVAWMTVPVLLFPLDEPLDPARFGHLPVPPARLAVGLALAGLLTPPALLPLAFVGTGVWSFGGGPAAWAGGLLLLAQFGAASQLVTLGASALLRSRRGRDLAVVAVAAVGVGAFAFQQAASREVSRIGLTGALLAHPLSDVARLLPPTAAQDAIARAAAGDPAGALLSLLAAAAWLVAMSVAAHRLLVWIVTSPESSRPLRSRRSRGLVGGPTWSPVAVVARKELRVYLRDPRLRAVWTGGIIFLGILFASLALGTATMSAFHSSPWLTTAAPVVVLFVGLPVALNQLGWERKAAAFLFSLPLSPARILLGKNLALAVALAAETALLSLVLAGLTGAWGRLLVVAPLTIAAIGCQLAIGNLVSVLAPLRLPAPGTDLFGQAGEQGLLALLAQAFAFAVTGLLLVPVAVAAFLFEAGELPASAVAAIAVAWGLAVYAAALGPAAALLGRRMPEVAEAVTPV